MSAEPRIEPAYDGTSAALKGLAALGWGPLLNLGYFPFWGILLAPVKGLALYQQALARRSIGLLEPHPGERILDVACGRGWTTQEIASRGAEVVGLDLLERHVEEARRRYGQNARLSFARGDARDLSPDHGSFDKIHCLEAAFHFGPRGRRAFLEHSFRVLRPGGRLVLVDFVWRDDRPQEIALVDAGRHVRDTWCFEEFEPLDRYRSTAAEIGFREKAIADWTGPVLDRVQHTLDMLVWIASFRIGRAIGRWRMPGLGALLPEDWDALGKVVHAHDQVRARSRYVAMVFEKPRRAP